MNNCLNCGKPCKEKYCDRLCYHGFSARMYRELDKENRYEKTE